MGKDWNEQISVHKALGKRDRLMCYRGNAMKEGKDIHCYDDIINLPHHTSNIRPPMSLSDRAAQFSPFAAMVGHDEAIEETARLTDRRIELSEDEKARLNEKLRRIVNDAGHGDEVEIIYFVPDERKIGGKYVTKTGRVKRIDEDERTVIMEDWEKIRIEEIWEIYWLPIDTGLANKFRNMR